MPATPTMAMNATFFTRCLRTTPLSLFRQQIPKQQQQLSWSPKMTRAYSTTPSPPQENNGSEKPAEKEAAATSNSADTTSTTAAPNTETSRADQPLSEAAARKLQSKRLLDNLKLKPAPKQSSRTSRPSSGVSQPLSSAVSGENELSESMHVLESSMQQIAQKPIEKAPVRDPVAPTTESPTPSPEPSKTTAPQTLREPERKSRPTIKTVPMKLGPKLGRQIMVQNDKGVDCATAIRTLEMTCRSNHLRKQEASQRFHVRRGQARKNLRIQRWRKLFKFSFLETVKRIDRMRDQGW
ncbi:hypothetical protein PISL3812_08449 [Talaromyces islandicus]|uniref:Ribosomal protein S21 n=1 Tax=Talaromyces islandicus TaxID=28573 RepID=A0A0U1M8L9_TALIS|nr:hypothetical protein PISL3812_08449 [Talaromyces islandicus]